MSLFTHYFSLFLNNVLYIVRRFYTILRYYITVHSILLDYDEALNQQYLQQHYFYQIISISYDLSA